MDEYKAQVQSYGTAESQQVDEAAQPGDGSLSSADADAPARAGIPLKGGPNKIRGIQQSAADAQAEREKFAQNQEGHAGAADGDDGDAPIKIPIKGGPNKISSLKLSAEEAQRQREQFDKEQQEKFGQGEAGPGGAAADGDCPVDLRVRGGPNKISGILQSSEKAQEEREKAGEDDQGGC